MLQTWLWNHTLRHGSSYAAFTWMHKRLRSSFRTLLASNAALSALHYWKSHVWDPVEGFSDSEQQTLVSARRMPARTRSVNWGVLPGIGRPMSSRMDPSRVQVRASFAMAGNSWQQLLGLR